MQYDTHRAAEKLQIEFKRIRYMAYLMIAMVAAVILVSVLRKFWLTLFFIAATVFIQLFVFRKMQKNYVEHAVLENIKATVGKALHTDNAVITGSEMLAEDVIREAALVPVMDNKGAINRFAAVSGYAGTGDKQMEVTSCDVSLAVHQAGTKISADIVCGNWIHIQLPEETKYHFTVTGGKVRGFSTGLEEKENREEDNSIDSVKADGIAQLPECFYRKLEKLEGYTTGALSMRVDGDMANVFLKDRFLSGKFSARSEITEQMIDWNPLPELEKVLDLVWTLI